MKQIYAAPLLTAEQCADVRRLALPSRYASVGFARMSIGIIQIAPWIRELMGQAITAGSRHAGHPDLGLNDRPEPRAFLPRVTTYRSPSGSFDWHEDQANGPARTIIKPLLTAVAQLTDPECYAGGALSIKAPGGLEYAPLEQGSVVVFPSAWLHSVSRVEEGTRDSLVFWSVPKAWEAVAGG